MAGRLEGAAVTGVRVRDGARPADPLSGALLAVVLAVVSAGAHGASHCAAQGASTEQACAQEAAPGDPAKLPEAARAEADRLRAEMRFMLATGHAERAQAHQALIDRIFRDHGMTAPEAYRGL